jgi:hypothetical protein
MYRVSLAGVLRTSLLTSGLVAAKGTCSIRFAMCPSNVFSFVGLVRSRQRFRSACRLQAPPNDRLQGCGAGHPLSRTKVLRGGPGSLTLWRLTPQRFIRTVL